MRNFILLLAAFMSTVALTAQTIPNSNFENWTTTTHYEDPQDLYTNNSQAYFSFYNPVISKTSDSYNGSFAIKMETHIIGTDTIFGMLTNGNFQLGGNMNGQPFTSKPDSFMFQAKYDIPAGDSAVVACLFQNQGNMIGVGIYSFTGSSNSYVQKSAPIMWFGGTQNPDTMVFVAASSHPDYNPMDGSWVQIDDFEFNTGNDVLPNADFENWNDISSEDPDSWHSYNPFLTALGGSAYVTKTSDSYDGSFAMQIESTSFSGGPVAHCTMGQVWDDSIVGGMQVNSNPKKISGYYKYIPNGNDTAYAVAYSIGENYTSGKREMKEENYAILPPAANYTAFEINFQYTGYPAVDTIRFGFLASNIFQGVNFNDGSKLLIDSLNISYYPVGIEETDKDESVKVYPNPASNYVNFEFENRKQGVLSIYNMNSKLVYSEEINSEKHQINTNKFAKGLYLYSFKTEEKVIFGKFTVNE